MNEVHEVLEFACRLQFLIPPPKAVCGGLILKSAANALLEVRLNLTALEAFYTQRVILIGAAQGQHESMRTHAERTADVFKLLPVKCHKFATLTPLIGAKTS